MKAREPLLIGAQMREGPGEVSANEAISLFERSHTKAACIRARVMTSASVKAGRQLGDERQPARRGCFEVVVNEAIDLSHLIYNGSQGVVLLVQSLVKTLLHLRRPSFSTQDSR